MLSTHKKYLIDRNKRVLAFLVDKISHGKGVRKALREAAQDQDLKVSYGAAKSIYYLKNYPYSPYFEYDQEGRPVYEKDEHGNHIPGTETEFYREYLSTLNIFSKTA